MENVLRRKFTVVVGLLVLGQPVGAADLMTLFGPACASVGIDTDRCQCVVAQVVERHGEGAARYVGLDMNLRYDEAAEQLAAVGESQAFAASETFEVAQNTTCSAARLARQQGSWSGGDASGGAVVASAVAAPQAPTVGSSGTTAVFDATTDVPIIDLRAHRGGAIVDVSGRFDSAAVAAASATNFRNFIGFYPIADRAGGIDINGDGAADVHPGDPSYTVTAQARVLRSPLYWRADGGPDQVLGEIRLPGGSRYAPIVRYRDDRRPSVPAVDPSAAEQIASAMATNANLFFAFVDVHGGQRHLRKLSENTFGFRVEASAADSVIVSIDTLVLE
ncbi:MAG: hypothetical protein AAGH76_17165 [Pseudomonadota bacterium]